jgi:beta-phosphoglucomutase-like phosphatase (HAD superfamily)
MPLGVSVKTGICVIFDLDGTLVDSEGLCNQAFLDLLPQLSDTVETLNLC